MSFSQLAQVPERPEAASEGGPTIAVLMTAHQQREQVLSSIAAVQRSRGCARIFIYLVDDGSTDGTAAAVGERFRNVHVIPGDGRLYWVGAMRKAFDCAIAKPYDYHLWLNSDTVLAPNSLGRLIRIARGAQQLGRVSIVSGATLDPYTRELTSGAFKRRGLRLMMSLRLVSPGAHTIECDTVNGNCLLVPREVFEAVGNLSEHLTHRLADLDYGFRAKERGFRLLLASDYCGFSPALRPCPPLPWRTAFAALRGPKGVISLGDPPTSIMPESEWRWFVRRHFGVWWVIPWLAHYAKFIWLLASSRRRKP